MSNKISRREVLKATGALVVGGAIGGLATLIPDASSDSEISSSSNINRGKMKVILVNGSPHESGCTYTALQEVAVGLEKNDVQTEMFWLGNKAISGCLGCGFCRKNGHCTMSDIVDDFVKKADTADGFIFGSPVHYAGASGFITPFLDRVFYSGGSHFALKPGASVVSARRAGTTAALDQLNKYFPINNMPMVPSQYWNMVHGNSPEEVRKDLEGTQIMRTLGMNMAWLLKCIAAGKAAGVGVPKYENRVGTNFIR
jgi:multimeric flavodoxin WrbA